jgi:hypothetical protein
MTSETQAALDYLKQRGHVVRQSIVTHEGEMRVWIDNLLLNYPHIRGFAALERMKASVQGVNSWALTEMAVACSKLADSGKLDLQTASEARALKHQWGVLVQAATPRAGSAAEAASIDRQAKALADRAVGFLSTQLHLLCN